MQPQPVHHTRSADHFHHIRVDLMHKKTDIYVPDLVSQP